VQSVGKPASEHARFREGAGNEISGLLKRASSRPTVNRGPLTQDTDPTFRRLALRIVIRTNSFERWPTVHVSSFL
jgi:hypothetical protein